MSAQLSAYLAGDAVEVNAEEFARMVSEFEAEKTVRMNELRTYLREVHEDDEKLFRITSVMMKQEGKKDVKVTEMREHIGVIVALIVEGKTDDRWLVGDNGVRYYDFGKDGVYCRVRFYSKRDNQPFGADYGLSFTFRKR
jgi:hypothetical protein